MNHLIKSIFAMGIFSFLALGKGFAQSHDFADFGRYEKMNAEIRQSAKSQKRVVFLGNSITDNWAEMRPEFFTSNDYIGRGISGQTSYQFLLRFREDVVKLHPDLVIINAGTNDIAENTGSYVEEHTFGNILSMVDIARANGIQVILTSVLPAARFGWNEKVTDGPAKIQALNKRLERYAKENKLRYVDYYSALVDKDGITLRKDYSEDGVHPTHQGYEVMEKIIKKAIRRTL